MNFVKVGKQIIRTELNAAEKAAINKEIQGMIKDYLVSVHREVDAMVLYTLMCTKDYTEEELHDFYREFANLYDYLLERYELRSDDMEFVYTQKLLAKGIDISKWEDE